MMELSDQSMFLLNSSWNFSILHPFNVTDEEILKILDDYRKSQFTLAEAKTIVLITLSVGDGQYFYHYSNEYRPLFGHPPPYEIQTFPNDKMRPYSYTIRVGGRYFAHLASTICEAN
ncbi:hypothetical protein CHS0354_011663 [Potamilus streckersoni]|uniref:Uncharacterized protein n=1 Tax=Potamilus streckersoni TaxID=2493646 RepID=A0AAE0TL78_9BIVA|nr:hypothetical protein CHS0354_011663 [Potamilus streckersoni]